MSDNKIIDLKEKRAQKDRADFADAVAKEMGVSTEGLANMVDSSPDEIRESLIDAWERATLYRAHDEAKKEQERKRGLDPDACHNGVCPRNVQYEHEHTNPVTGEITFSGRSNFCKEGEAQGCIYRLMEHPISDPFVDIPSHNECIRILQRIGYVRESSFEEEYGTNFMQRKATRKLWEAYVRLLVDTGRVKIPDDEWDNVKHHEEEHAKFVGGQELAHEYLRDRELPDGVATIAELVAQRDALIAFIRGEIDWPDGRCPCGEDVHWNGVAHTPNCRLNPLRTESGRFSSQFPNYSNRPGCMAAPRNDKENEE